MCFCRRTGLRPGHPALVLEAIVGALALGIGCFSGYDAVHYAENLARRMLASTGTVREGTKASCRSAVAATK